MAAINDAIRVKVLVDENNLTQQNFGEHYEDLGGISRENACTALGTHMRAQLDAVAGGEQADLLDR